MGTPQAGQPQLQSQELQADLGAATKNKPQPPLPLLCALHVQIWRGGEATLGHPLPTAEQHARGDGPDKSVREYPVLVLEHAEQE